MPLVHPSRAVHAYNLHQRSLFPVLFFVCIRKLYFRNLQKFIPGERKTLQFSPWEPPPSRNSYANANWNVPSHVPVCWGRTKAEGWRRIQLTKYVFNFCSRKSDVRGFGVNQLPTNTSCHDMQRKIATFPNMKYCLAPAFYCYFAQLAERFKSSRSPQNYNTNTHRDISKQFVFQKCTLLHTAIFGALFSFATFLPCVIFRWEADQLPRHVSPSLLTSLAFPLPATPKSVWTWDIIFKNESGPEVFCMVTPNSGEMSSQNATPEVDRNVFD